MEPVVCEGTCTVTLTVEAAPLSPERAEDLLGMFWSFVLVLVVVWGLKQILKIFTAEP